MITKFFLRYSNQTISFNKVPITDFTKCEQITNYSNCLVNYGIDIYNGKYYPLNSENYKTVESLLASKGINCNIEVHKLPYALHEAMFIKLNNENILLSKRYQDLEFHFFLYINKAELLMNLRKGQNLTFDIILTYIYNFGGSSAMDNFNLYGFVTDITPEVKMLKCENGHEFAPSSGYRFCPECGKPVK